MDFRLFLFLIWKHLGLPDPTERQYEIAEYLQHGPRRKIIMAFRGIGKSWITSAFVLWLLWNNSELKILVVSASKDRSDAFSIFTKRLLAEVDFLSHLAPDPRLGDRDSNVAFDVRGCRPAHAPSVKSVGITGQIAGSRADFIVGDDVEVPNNSETATQREKLVTRSSELGGAVLTPDSQNPDGGVAFLGTPQVEETLYEELQKRGYETRIWPAQMPDDLGKYGDRLSPGIANSGLAPGDATDPDRFDLPELAERRIEFGAAGYALQFMLDTDTASENTHPLKTKDFIVMDVDVDVAPDFVVWSGGDAQTMEHLSRVGLAGDRFQGPMKVSPDFSPYQDTLMYIDPSGRGNNQTAYVILKMLNGVVFLYDWGALDGGYDNQTLTKLAAIARNGKVNLIVVEDNFGNGMYAQLLRPVLLAHCRFKRKDGTVQEGVTVEDHHVTGQKETRAIETIEPLLAGHRLVIDESLVKRVTATKDKSHDVDAALKSGFFQLTRLTKERGCLKYDDWIDALAGAVGWWTDSMDTSTKTEANLRAEERLDEELQKFMDGVRGAGESKTWNTHLTSERP